MGTRTVTLSATLKDSAGNALASKTVSFQYKTSSASTWSSAGSANTDSTGTARVSVNLSAPNTYDFQASFAGDSEYEPSSASVTGVKVKSPTSISLSASSL